LGFGLLGLFTLVPCNGLAILFGIRGLRANPNDQMAKAGVILGGISMVITISIVTILWYGTYVSRYR
jgi:hypothetical protein